MGEDKNGNVITIILIILIVLIVLVGGFLFYNFVIKSNEQENINIQETNEVNIEIQNEQSTKQENQNIVINPMEPIDGINTSKGEWENNVYTNSTLGLKFILPEGWNYYSDEDIEIMQQSAANESVLHMMATYTQNNSAINVTIMSYQNNTEIDSAQFIESMKNAGAEIGTIANKDCYTMRVQQTEGTADSYMYIYNNNVVMIVVTAIRSQFDVANYIQEY